MGVDTGSYLALPLAILRLFPSQGMKVSCTHFQCAAGAFAYLREHFPHAYSVDMSRQILTLNVNLMLVRRCPCWGPVESGDGDGWCRLLDQALCRWQWGLGFELLSPGGSEQGSASWSRGGWRSEDRGGESLCGPPDGKGKISG